MIKLGSLFDGIGAFPLAASRYGITPVWASEIEKFPISVTSKHFPNMKHLGDIREIDGSEIEPVDIITFGSPCQDLSVSGKRAGIQDGERSHLFFEAIRIINEMRIKTNGEYPTFAIWENVPGALSSNGGADFRSVLRSLAEVGAIDIAWRILDAQYFGVPQRRRRIFLIADFRGERAGEIFSEPEGLSRNPAESRRAREEVAGSAGEGVKESSNGIISFCLTPWDVQSKRIYERDGKWPALYSGDGGGGAHGYVAQSIPIHDVAQCLTSRTDCRYDAETETLPVDNYMVRRLIPIECLRLQGFFDWWLDGVEGYSDTRAYRAIGNSIAVPCLEWIFSRLVRLM